VPRSHAEPLQLPLREEVARVAVVPTGSAMVARVVLRRPPEAASVPASGLRARAGGGPGKRLYSPPSTPPPAGGGSFHASSIRPAVQQVEAAAKLGVP
jgi:hypothetical protein